MYCAKDVQIGSILLLFGLFCNVVPGYLAHKTMLRYRTRFKGTCSNHREGSGQYNPDLGKNT